MNWKYNVQNANGSQTAKHIGSVHADMYGIRLILQQDAQSAPNDGMTRSAPDQFSVLAAANGQSMLIGTKVLNIRPCVKQSGFLIRERKPIQSLANNKKRSDSLLFSFYQFEWNWFFRDYNCINSTSIVSHSTNTWRNEVLGGCSHIRYRTIHTTQGSCCLWRRW